MPYRLPTFNTTAAIYRGNAPPPAAPVTTVLAQWRYYNRLCVPVEIDLRDPYSSSGADIVEILAGSGRLYDVLITDFVAFGFSNEYRFALLQKRPDFPAPDPYPGG